MKPGRPTRRTPLQVGTPLVRKTRLRPVSAKRVHEQVRWSHLRTVVFTRDEGRCVHCGTNLHAVRWECHHRKLRSAGGPDIPFNLVALCLTHHSWAHLHRLLSEPLGLIVPSRSDPALIPVTYFDGTRRLLAEREAA